MVRRYSLALSVILSLTRGSTALPKEGNLRQLNRGGASDPETNSENDGCARRIRPEESVIDILTADSSLFRTLELVQLLGLFQSSEEGGTGYVTLFAPTDIAYDDAKIFGLINRLYEPPYFFHAQDLLKFHMVEDVLCGSALDVARGLPFETANGNSLTSVVASDSSYTLQPTEDYGASTATILELDNFASNGVVHSIDQLLLPRWVFQELLDLSVVLPGFSTLNELIVFSSNEAMFTDETHRVTLFAPNDDAFDALDAEILDCLRNDPAMTTSLLRSHAVNGLHSSISLSTSGPTLLDSLESDVSMSVTTTSGSIAVNGVEVVEPDHLAYSGILHEIGSVLFESNFLCAFEPQSSNEAGTVLGILREEGLTTLVGAFLDLSAETRACLAGSTQALTSLIQYHTLDTMYLASDLEIAQLLPTNDGRSILVNGLTAADDMTQINDAGITEGDILASNGVIHTISRVVHATGANCM